MFWPIEELTEREVIMGALHADQDQDGIPNGIESVVNRDAYNTPDNYVAAVLSTCKRLSDEGLITEAECERIGVNARGAF